MKKFEELATEPILWPASEKNETQHYPYSDAERRVAQSSDEFVEQRLRLFEIGSTEPFGEPAVDRGE
jgi:hypothetical protein